MIQYSLHEMKCFIQRENDLFDSNIAPLLLSGTDEEQTITSIITIFSQDTMNQAIINDTRIYNADIIARHPLENIVERDNEDRITNYQTRITEYQQTLTETVTQELPTSQSTQRSAARAARDEFLRGHYELGPASNIIEEINRLFDLSGDGSWGEPFPSGRNGAGMGAQGGITFPNDDDPVHATTRPISTTRPGGVVTATELRPTHHSQRGNIRPVYDEAGNLLTRYDGSKVNPEVQVLANVVPATLHGEDAVIYTEAQRDAALRRHKEYEFVPPSILRKPARNMFLNIIHKYILIKYILYNIYE